MRGIRGRLVDLVLALGVAALDQWTKALVRHAIPLHQERPVIEGWLSLRHGQNPGLAFGLLSRAGLPHQPVWLALAGLGALCLIVLCLTRLPDHARLARAGLALILGGAAGNLWDRALLGSVTDFVHVFHGTWQWHDFNLADAAISLGVALFLLSAVQRR